MNVKQRLYIIDNKERGVVMLNAGVTYVKVRQLGTASMIQHRTWVEKRC